MKLFLAATVLVALLSPVAVADELPSWMNERKIMGENDLQSTSDLRNESIYGILRGVAIVETSFDNGYCTASRVGKNLFMTNFHCEDAIPCERVYLRMGYEKGVNQREQRVFKCQEVLAKSLVYDYAIYRAEPMDDLPNDVEAYPVLTLDASEMQAGMELTIAGHPRGRKKEVDASGNCVLLTDEIESLGGRDTLKHMCDTEGGSSGSPVIDNGTGNIVAIHWGGVREQFNLAVPMYLALEDMRQQMSQLDFLDLNVAE